MAALCLCGCERYELIKQEPIQEPIQEQDPTSINHWLPKIKIIYCEEKTNFTLRACGFNRGPFNSFEEAQKQRTNWAVEVTSSLAPKEQPAPCGIEITNAPRN